MVPGAHGLIEPATDWGQSLLPTPAWASRLQLCGASDMSIGEDASLAGKPGGGPTVGDTPLMEVLVVVVDEDAIEA